MKAPQMTKDLVINNINRLLNVNYKSFLLKFWHKLQSHDRRILIICHDLFLTILACRVALFLTLDGSDALLSSGFFVKQYCVVGFIAFSFFLWFQTYKGVWRFFSLRQGILLCIVTGLTSLTYTPLLIRASLSPVEIPLSAVGVFWLLQTGALVGSRLVSRAVRFHQIMRDAVAQLPVKPNHVILIGQKSAIKSFQKRFSLLKDSPLDVLGVIVTDYKSDKDLDEAETQIANYDVLGHVGDIRSLYDEFISDDLAPHQIIFVDNSLSSKEIQTLLSAFDQTPLQFAKMTEELPLGIRPLQLFDVYETDLPALNPVPFQQKSLLILGAANPVGEALVKELLDLKVNHVTLWDTDVFGLEALKFSLLHPKHPKAHSKSVEDLLSFSSLGLDNDEQITKFIQQGAPDIVINLRSFIAAAAESFDPFKPYDIYLRENTDFLTSSLKNNVKNYVFVTSEVPHHRDSNRLSAIMGNLLKSMVKTSKESVFEAQRQKSDFGQYEDKNSTNATSNPASNPTGNLIGNQRHLQNQYYAINIPFVLSDQSTHFFSASKVSVTQKDLSVCSPYCAAHMILQSVINMNRPNEQNDLEGESRPNSGDQDLSGPDYNFDIVTFESLLSQYKMISKKSSLSSIHYQPLSTLFDWPEDQQDQRKIFSSLHRRDLRTLKSLLKNARDE